LSSKHSTPRRLSLPSCVRCLSFCVFSLWMFISFVFRLFGLVSRPGLTDIQLCLDATQRYTPLSPCCLSRPNGTPNRGQLTDSHCDFSTQASATHTFCLCLSYAN
jgi:hypothetical protein